MVTVVNVLSFGFVGDRPDALALHEVTTCTVSVPMLLNACFVMQDWWCASRIMQRALADVHIYCKRVLCTQVRIF